MSSFTLASSYTRATCAGDLWHIPIRWHVSYKNVFFGLKRKSPRGYYVVHIKLLHHIIYHTIEAYVASADYNIIPSFSYLRKKFLSQDITEGWKNKTWNHKTPKKNFPCLCVSTTTLTLFPIPWRKEWWRYEGSVMVVVNKNKIFV